ncbi:MAG TPA: hypothetical protein VF257_09785 [Solirubrobacteraceae bacterium]
MNFDVPPRPTPPIPAAVCDEIDAAAVLAEDLHAQGRAVRFDVRERDGVVAELVDDQGALLRRLVLAEVIDIDRLAFALSTDPRP